MSPPALWMLHGPTASGKTRLAIDIAEAIGASILNCDARQVYRELNIGVARPSAEELQSVPHQGIATHSIHAPLTAMSYAQWARPWIQQELDAGRSIVIVGGSGLYAKALLYHSDALPQADPELRAILEARWEDDPDGLIKELQKKDPLYADKADLKNSRRVIRALEVILSTGMPYSSQRTTEATSKPFFRAALKEWAIWPDMDALTKQIHRRTKEMMRNGLPEEAHSLSPFKDFTAMQTVGYREFYQAPLSSLAVIEASIALHTRQYAKRQLTWLKKQPHVQPIPQAATLTSLLR